MKPEDTVQNGKQIISQGIKRRIYDLLAAIIIVAIFVSALRIFDFTPWTNIKDILIEFGPFYLALILLGFDQYEKGGFVGKSTLKFQTAVEAYSSVVDNIDGAQLDVMPEFCNEFNDKALKDKQTRILKKYGLKYEYLYEPFTYKDAPMPALCDMEESEYKQYFTKKQAACIIEALNATVVGITPEKLMTELQVNDSTDIGENETSMKKKHSITSIFRYILTAVVLSLIGVKDISKWHWTGFLIVIFKCAVSFAKSYIEYFRGYDDVSIKLHNHILRKTDILKQFNAWYTAKTSANCNTKEAQ